MPDTPDEFEQLFVIDCPICHKQNPSWNPDCSWCGAPMNDEQGDKLHTMENAA